MKEQSWMMGQSELRGLDNQGKGPLIIGLHGFLDNAASMLPLAPYLSEYQFVAIDWPGHGKSPHRSVDAHYHLLDYIQDLYNLCESQNWQDVILVGHSMGGIIASIFAASFPEHVLGVVSLDACGPLTLPADKSAEQLKAAVTSRLPKPKRDIPVDLEQAITARCKVSDIAPEHARLILERNITTLASGQTIWQSDSKLRTKSTLRLTESQAQNFMENIQCPICFVGADKSFKQVEQVYALRTGWLKNSQLTMFSGGHHIHMEKPCEISEVICSFVDHL